MLTCSFFVLIMFLADDEQYDDSDAENILALEDDACALPSKETIYLNRDFLRAGQNRVTIKDITDFTVFMWDNRYMRDLTYNRNNIAPVTDEYRMKTHAQVDYFRRQCWSMVNLETKQMLTKEVRKAFKDENFNMESRC